MLSTEADFLNPSHQNIISDSRFSRLKAGLNKALQKYSELLAKPTITKIPAVTEASERKQPSSAWHILDLLSRTGVGFGFAYLAQFLTGFSDNMSSTTRLLISTAAPTVFNWAYSGATHHLALTKTIDSYNVRKSLRSKPESNEPLLGNFYKEDLSLLQAVKGLYVNPLHLSRMLPTFVSTSIAPTLMTIGLKYIVEEYGFTFFSSLGVFGYPLIASFLSSIIAMQGQMDTNKIYEAAKRNFALLANKASDSKFFRTTSYVRRNYDQENTEASTSINIPVGTTGEASAPASAAGSFAPSSSLNRRSNI